MKTRLTSTALCAAALTFALPNLLFSQIFIPSGGPLFNTGGNNVGIGIAAPTGKLEIRSGESQAALFIQNLQSQGPSMDPLPPATIEPSHAIKIMTQEVDQSGNPSANKITFAIKPNGSTSIGNFTATAPDMLAVRGSMGLFHSVQNYMRFRCTPGWGSEIIWSSEDNRNLSFKNEQLGTAGMLLSPGGKFAVGSTVLDGDHRLRAKGSAVAEVLQVQIEGDWGTNNNNLGLSTVDGNHFYWRTPDQKIEFRSEGNTPLVLHSSGKVGINTDSMPGNHSLYVKGSLIAEENIIQIQQEWADFVFEPDYPLMPLPELQSYLSTHKHLPEFPSAAEVAENGLYVGETQRLLTIKVEELTLYLLQMSEEVKALREEISTLRGEK